MWISRKHYNKLVDQIEKLDEKSRLLEKLYRSLSKNYDSVVNENFELTKMLEIKPKRKTKTKKEEK